MAWNGWWARIKSLFIRYERNTQQENGSSQNATLTSLRSLSEEDWYCPTDKELYDLKSSSQGHHQEQQGQALTETSVDSRPTSHAKNEADGKNVSISRVANDQEVISGHAAELEITEQHNILPDTRDPAHNTLSLLLYHTKSTLQILERSSAVKFNKNGNWKSSEGRRVEVTIPVVVRKKNDNHKAEVTCRVKPNGILLVRAIKEVSGERDTFTNSKAHSASDNEMSQIREELRFFHEKELLLEKRVDAKLNLENYVLELKRALETTTGCDEVSDQEKDSAKDACCNMLVFIEDNDEAELDTFVTELNTFRKMYEPLKNKLRNQPQ